MADVVVAGAGPSGWALASACADEGLDTTVIAPVPHARWPATYGLWRDELPDLPPGAIAAAPARTLAAGTSRQWLDRSYLVLDNDGLRRLLTHPGVGTVTGRVTGFRDGTVHLHGGGTVRTPVLVDATGGRAHHGMAQTAYGLVVPAPHAERLVPADTALIMDWSNPAREPSFLYGIPVGRGQVLLEETCLARAPGLQLDILAGRLRHRLTTAGIPLEGDLDNTEELVRIPLGLPRPRRLAFGTAAGMIHPATGYSLADALKLAPAVAAALHEGLATSGEHAMRAARHVIWPPSARTVHALRRFGMGVLGGLPGELLAEFFELFFRLPTELQRAFTSGRCDVAGTVAAMGTLFASAPWRIRIRLVR